LPAADAAAASHSVTIRLTAIQKAVVMTPHVGFVESDVDQNQAGKTLGQDSLVCRFFSDHKPPRCTAIIGLAKGDLLGIGTADQAGGKGTVLKGTGGFAGCGRVYQPVGDEDQDRHPPAQEVIHLATGPG
jgi:hypothetical protein